MRQVYRLALAHLIVTVTLLLGGCLNPQYLPPVATPLPSNTMPTPQSDEQTESTPPEGMEGEIPFENMQDFPSPSGEWTVHVGESSGRVMLEDDSGTIYTLFEPISTIGAVEWSPNEQHLLVAQHAWPDDTENSRLDMQQALQLWLVEVNELGPGQPQLLYQSQVMPTEGSYPAEQIQVGAWSPDSRHVPFWIGPVGSSVRNDGLSLWIADIDAASSTPLAEMALLNPYYQSWSPDSSALAFVAGGNRSAQVSKWLNLYNVATGQVTNVVSVTEQVPGIVAWSPMGDWIAYAAIPAEETGPEWEGLMTFDNPAIDGRRLYLLDPATGERQRFNDVEAFQDAPRWSSDGTKLYYVERHDDMLALMVADLTTGEAELVAGSERPLPEMVGYYGQGNWEEYWAAIERAEESVLPSQVVHNIYVDSSKWSTYRHEALGVEVHYPPQWQVVDVTQAFARFVDPAQVGEAFNIVNGGFAIEDIADFVEHIGPDVIATKTLSIDGQPALLMQLEAGAEAAGYRSVLGILTADKRTLTIGNKAVAPAVFEEIVGSIQLFEPLYPP